MEGEQTDCMDKSDSPVAANPPHAMLIKPGQRILHLRRHFEPSVLAGTFATQGRCHSETVSSAFIRRISTPISLRTRALAE